MGFLLWWKVPRWQMFEILFASAWIYALAFFLSLQFMDANSSRSWDQVIPYLLPVLPVTLFVVWKLRRSGRARR